MRIDFRSHDVIALPINLHKHWTLGLLYPKEQRVEFLDSAPRMEVSNFMVNILKEIFCWLWNKQGELSTSNHTSITIANVGSRDMKSEEQGNGVDCGVYTLTNWLAVANSLPIDTISEVIVQEKRWRIADELRQKLNYNT